MCAVWYGGDYQTLVGTRIKTALENRQSVALGESLNPHRLAVAGDATDTATHENRSYGCHVAELYNEERPHDSLGRVPPLTFHAEAHSYTGVAA